MIQLRNACHRFSDGSRTGLHCDVNCGSAYYRGLSNEVRSPLGKDLVGVGSIIPHENSKATAGKACHMFLLSMHEGHEGKTEIASCPGDTKACGSGLLRVPWKHINLGDAHWRGNWIQRPPL